MSTWIVETHGLEKFCHSRESQVANPEDQCAVAIKKSGATVRHVPFNLAPVISAFLKRSCNKGLVEVTGNRVNQGAGYGL